ncbi:hypothetical protein M407DRAFT_74553, partial [Tulasnella calospora MUT 4182]
EVELLAGLSHPNIVKFIGFMEDLKNGKASMVFTWEDNGNVRDFLAFGDCEIQDVMAGVEYLHTRKPPICHSDLKSLNILVNSSYRAVITDFGSARQLTLTGPAWSLRWAAPEVLFGKRPDLPRDIWAVGWVIWEVSWLSTTAGSSTSFAYLTGNSCYQIITDKIPFHELNSEVYITMTVIQRKIPPIGQDAQMSQIVSLCSLMTECWAYNPKSRPSASKCRALVQWMVSHAIRFYDDLYLIKIGLHSLQLSPPPLAKHPRHRISNTARHPSYSTWGTCNTCKTTIKPLTLYTPRPWKRLGLRKTNK